MEDSTGNQQLLMENARSRDDQEKTIAVLDVHSSACIKIRTTKFATTPAFFAT